MRSQAAPATVPPRHAGEVDREGAGVTVLPLPSEERAGEMGFFRKAISTTAILLIRLYQATLSPLLGGHCRFHPTCSEYAIEAFRTHNPVRAFFLTARRLLRCHPFGGSGWDPVPAASDENE